MSGLGVPAGKNPYLEEAALLRAVQGAGPGLASGSFTDREGVCPRASLLTSLIGHVSGSCEVPGTLHSVGLKLPWSPPEPLACLHPALCPCSPGPPYLLLGHLPPSVLGGEASGCGLRALQ